MSKFDGSIGSKILDEGMTPAQWIVVLAAKDIIISERTLREKAREKGAYYCLARTMLITPQQMDIIYEEGQPCHLKSISEAITSGPKDRSITTVGRSPAHTGEALRHLQKRVHGTG